MSYVTWKVERVPFDNNAWNLDDTQELTTYYDPLITVELGDTKDSFNFKVTNVNETFSNFFSPQDKIIISRAISNDSTASSDILMTGSIKSVPEEETFNQDLIRVEGYNFTEAIMSALVFVDAENLTIPQALQAGINTMNAYITNSAARITWSSTNPTLRSDATAFPLVGQKFYYKPLRDMFEKYSKATATGDGNYYWYVDKNNVLYWRRQTNTIDATFNSATDDYRSKKIGKNSDDVVNFVVVKGGLDPNNNPIQDKYLDLSSINKHSQRYKVIPDITSNAKTIVKQDLDASSVTKAEDLTYPFTTTWSTVLTVAGDGYTVNGSNHIVAADYDGYVQAVRDHTKKRCRQEGQNYVEQYKFGKLKLDLIFAPGKTWQLGNVISVTIPSLGSTAKLLRVKSIQYSTTSDTFTLEEDSGTI